MSKTGRSAGLGFILIFTLFFTHSLFAETFPIDEQFEEEELFLVDESIAALDPFSDDDFDDDSLYFEAIPIIIEAAPFIGIRSFEDVFSNLSEDQKEYVFSDSGLRYSFERAGTPMIVPQPTSGVDLLSSVMAKRPSHVVEALVVVPCEERELDLLDIYNALGKIENIKDHSISLQGRDIHIFAETTRLESARNRTAISDPLPADILPYSDTMYIRFTDAFFGDLFIRGDVSVSLYGITYNMTNFRDVRYSFIPIMRSERVSIIIYLEPIKEGILVYSMSGFYLPGLIANSANLTPSINRRITVLLSWITYGLKQQEILTALSENN